MKNIQIVLFVVLGLTIMDSCDDNPCTPEKPCIKTDTVYLKDSVTDTLLVYDTLDVFDTTTINDTLMVLDTMLVSTQTLDSAVCAVMSRFFDSRHYDTITKEQILGKWELIAFFDTTTCEVETQPEEFPNSNYLIFHENDSLSGRTAGNNFWDKYKVEFGKISFSDVGIVTALPEPEWGKDFLYAVYSTDHFTIFSNKLIMKSKKVLIFEKRAL